MNCTSVAVKCFFFYYTCCRMIENFLTLDTFNKGIQAYLNEFDYGNADRNDLWNSLTQAALVVTTYLEFGYSSFHSYMGKLYRTTRSWRRTARLSVT